MKAYYIHWSYPPSADDAEYYAGVDDSRFFHHKENAEAVAEKELRERKGPQFDGCFSEPNGYRVFPRNITFEDEE